MNRIEQKSDETVLDQLGDRLARQRLNRDWSQAELAAAAGVSVPTVSRIERGSSTSTANLVRVLRALDLVGNLEVLVPDPPASPMQQLRTRRRRRQRASRSRSATPTEEATPWRWGDET